MEAKTRILLAEDDTNLGIILQDYLSDKNFDVTLAENGEEAFSKFLKQQFDICILDIMMPLKDGFTLAREIREINTEIPILFLTAKSMKEDVLTGFKLGADDYIIKPPRMEELLMRINAILKRTRNLEKPIKTTFQLGSLVFDSIRQTLTGTDGNVQKLTTKESQLLKMLCENENQTLDRNVALNAIWENDSYFNARSMDVYITKLRKHLKNESGVEIINIHGKGFKLIKG
jgi:DNA-binding response OmpR family regulator